MKSELLLRFMTGASFGDGCWTWTRSISTQGYGRMWHTEKRRFVPTHRWSWEFFRDTIPEGLVIDHLCRNRRCVNPDHMEPVTIAVNVMRGEATSAINARKTHCKNGHPLADSNLVHSNPARRPRRICRICFNASARRRAKERRAAAKAVGYTDG